MPSRDAVHKLPVCLQMAQHLPGSHIVMRPSHSRCATRAGPCATHTAAAYMMGIHHACSQCKSSSTLVVDNHAGHIQHIPYTALGCRASQRACECVAPHMRCRTTLQRPTHHGHQGHPHASHVIGFSLAKQHKTHLPHHMQAPTHRACSTAPHCRLQRRQLPPSPPPYHATPDRQQEQVAGAAPGTVYTAMHGWPASQPHLAPHVPFGPWRPGTPPPRGLHSQLAPPCCAHLGTPAPPASAVQVAARHAQHANVWVGHAACR
jgi:hypothetical protein